MGESGKRLRCELLTPDGPVAEADAVSVTFPAPDGLVGVLPGRAAMVAQIGHGPLTLHPPAGDVREFFVAGGYLRVRDDAVRVLAEECVPVERLDRDAAWDAVQAAYELPAATEEQETRRAALLAKARSRFNLVQRRGRRLKEARRARLAAMGMSDEDEKIEE